MKKTPKNILIITLILALLTSLSNYSNSSKNIDELAYIMAIAIDIGTSAKYKITMQISTVESTSTEALTQKSGEDSSGGQSKKGSKSNYPNIKINTIEADSLDTAINIANAFVNKDISLSHCKILVISEELAKQGIKNIVNSIINKVEIRPDCNLIVSRIPADEFEDSSMPNLEKLLSEFYDISSNEETHSGYSQAVKIDTFYSNINDELFEGYATLITVTNPKKNNLKPSNNNNIDKQSKSLTNEDSEFSLETIGLAVFKDDKLVGTLTSVENMCHLLLINKLDNCIISMPSPLNPEETLDLYLFSIEDTKTNVKIINNSPFVTSKVNLVVRILSLGRDLNLIVEDELQNIKNSVTNYITEQIYNYYNKTAKELNSDISGVARFAIKNFKTTNEWKNYNWSENYKNSTFKVNVDISIRTGLLLTNE